MRSSEHAQTQILDDIPDDFTGSVRPILIGLEGLNSRSGGLERYFADLCHALSARGLSPVGVVLGEPAENARGLLVAGSSSDPLPIRLWNIWRATAASARRGTVLDVHFALHGLLPSLIRPVSRLPLAVHFQGPWAGESRLQGGGKLSCWVKRHIERAVYRRAGHVIVLCSEFRQILIDEYGVDGKRVTILAPGVDLRAFTPGPRPDARKLLGIEENTWVALSVRRLVPRMGLHVLLEAWAALGAEGPSGRDRLLLIAGDGPERAALEGRARELKLIDVVRFLGRIDHDTLVAAYRSANCTVVPSIALEGFGLVVLESLACGTPVIASDIGGLSDALRPLESDLLVPAGDPTALMERLRSDTIDRRPLPDSKSCREYAEVFSWDRVAERHHEIYRNLQSQARESRNRG